MKRRITTKLKRITPLEAAKRANQMLKDYGHHSEVAAPELADLMCMILQQEGYGDLVKIFDRNGRLVSND